MGQDYQIKGQGSERCGCCLCVTMNVCFPRTKVATVRWFTTVVNQLTAKAEIDLKNTSNRFMNCYNKTERLVISIF